MENGDCKKTDPSRLEVVGGGSQDTHVHVTDNPSLTVENPSLTVANSEENFEATQDAQDVQDVHDQQPQSKEQITTAENENILIIIIIKHKEKGCSHHFHVELERNLSTQMVAISKIKEEIQKLKKIPIEQQLLTLKKRKSKMIRVLNDEDSVEEVYLTDERNHKFTLRRIYEMNSSQRAKIICDQVKKKYDAWINSWLEETKNKDNSTIKVVSALIKENITQNPENITQNPKVPNWRFQIIAFAVGTKHNLKSCSLDSEYDICDAHAESLCFYGANLYFLHQFKKTDRDESSIFYLTKEGYLVYPYFRFHLFTSQAPCGFMSIESHDIMSWKPYYDKPHIPQCSSKILINAYLGIQGSVTHLLAKPVYIEDLIIVKYKKQMQHSTNQQSADQQSGDQQPTDQQPASRQQKKFAVFENYTNVEDKMQNFGQTLPNIGNFSFCKPHIEIVTKNKPKSMFEESYNNSDGKTGSLKSAVTIHDELQHEDITFYFKHDPEINTLTLLNECKPDWDYAVPPWWDFVHNQDASCQLPVFLELYSSCEKRFQQLKTALHNLSCALKIKEILESEIKTLSDEVDDANYLDDDISGMNQYLQLCKTEKGSVSINENKKKLKEHFKNLEEKVAQRGYKLCIIENITEVLDSFSDDERVAFDCDWDKIYTKIKKEFDKACEVD